MKRKATESIGVKAFASALLGLCGMLGAISAQSDEVVDWTRVIVVSSEPTHLRQFDNNFSTQLGFVDYEDNRIGCVEGCSELDAGRSAARLVYVFETKRKDVSEKLQQAWIATKRSVGDSALKLTFDSIAGPTCYAPCQSMPFCSTGCGTRTLKCNSNCPSS